MIFYLSAQLIAGLVREAVAGGYNETTPAAVVYRASWKDQTILKGTLEDIAKKTRDAGITRTAIIIIGNVIEPESYEYSKLYDKEFSHGYRRAKVRQTGAKPCFDPQARQALLKVPGSAEVKILSEFLGELPCRLERTRPPFCRINEPDLGKLVIQHVLQEGKVCAGEGTVSIEFLDIVSSRLSRIAFLHRLLSVRNRPDSTRSTSPEPSIL